MEPAHRRLIALLIALVLGSSLAPALAIPAAATPTYGAAATAPATTPANGAPRADQLGPLTLSVDRVTPTVATQTADTTVVVTVSNPTGATHTGLILSAALARTSLADRDALTTWSGHTERVVDAAQVATATVPTLTPGARVSVPIVIPKTVRTEGAFGVLPLVLQVSGPTATTPSQTRLPLPWLASLKQWVPMNLAWVAPVTLPANAALWTGTTSQVADAWRSAIGPQSTIRTRLAAAGAVPVTWLVDPSVLTVPTARGGPISAPEQTPTPGPTTTTAGVSPSPTGTATAAADPELGPLTGLATDLTGALTRLPADQVRALPATDPDLAALAGLDLPAGVSSLVRTTAATTLDAALGRSVDRTLAWPMDGTWSTSRAGTWASLTGTAPTTALVASDNLEAPQRQTPGALGTTADGRRVIAGDSVLAGLAADRSGRSTAEVVEAFLAQTLALLAEKPGTANRSYVVALPRTATVDAATLGALWSATATAPWLRSVSLAEVAKGEAGPVTFTTARSQVASPLTQSATAAVNAEQSALNSLASILPVGTEGFEGSWRSTVAQTLSGRWRGQQGPWGQLVTGTQRAITTATAGLQVSPTTINFLTDQGVIQLTVTNALPYPVNNVRLTLTPMVRKLRIDSAIPAISVRARSRTTIQVKVTATGAGTVPVQAQLSTADGYLLGSQQTVSMNVRPTGSWVFVIAAILAALVVIGGVVRSLRRSATRAERELTQEELTSSGDPAADPGATLTERRKGQTGAGIPESDVDNDPVAARPESGSPPEGAQRAPLP